MALPRILSLENTLGGLYGLLWGSWDYDAIGDTGVILLPKAMNLTHTRSVLSICLYLPRFSEIVIVWKDAPDGTLYIHIYITYKVTL